MILSTCHPAKKMQARGLCKSCYDKWLKSVNPKYKLAQQSNTTRWCKANPDKWAIIQERRRLKDLQDPLLYQKRRNAFLKRKYKITVEEYDRILLDQGGGCKLCFRKPGERKLHTDHDHKTGKVRGILCHQCNWFLGTVDADSSILNRIAKYINE